LRIYAAGVTRHRREKSSASMPAAIAMTKASW
jgi:hypothetical protein